MPDMLAFDAPSREVCVVKRIPTSTPQQAFVLLNDVQFVEAARVLAENAMHQSSDNPEAGCRYIFRQLTARDPDAKELALLVSTLKEQREILEKDPERATKLIAAGSRKVDPGLQPIELAANTLLAQAVLSLDATVWKR